MRKIMSLLFVRYTIIVVSGIICIGLTRSIISTLRQNDVVSERKAVLEREMVRNKDLQEQLKIATSDAFLEKQAREKLGLAREGETIVLLGEPQNSENQVNSSVSTPQSQWTKWWRLFF
jgi:cell division protein FtsB